MLKTLRLLFLFVAFLLIPAIVEVQACGGGDAVITGQVFSTTGGVNRPVKGAVVTSTYISGPWGFMPPDVSYTNSFGYFSLDTCIATAYLVEVNSGRYGYLVAIIEPLQDITVHNFYY